MHWRQLKELYDQISFYGHPERNMRIFRRVARAYEDVFLEKGGGFL
jgi:hypothetical protein